jgi:hypothetical protein
MGPVVASQEFDEEMNVHLSVFTWEVANGTTLEGPLPFGMFGRVEQMNMSKSKLVIRVAPGFPDDPQFPEVCTQDELVDNDLQKSVVCRKVVPVASATETGAGIWESIIQPLDATHGLRITRKTYVILPQQEFTLVREISLPSRFRELFETLEQSEVVAGTATLPTLQAGEELTSEKQVTIHTKRLTTRSLTLGSKTSLSGGIAYVEGTVGTITDEIFAPGTTPVPSAEQGLHIVESTVLELATGHYTRNTVEVDSWPVLHGSQYDELLNAQLLFTRQFVAPIDPLTVNTAEVAEYTPVNKDRTLKTTFTAPTDALDAFHVSFPSRANIQLPRVLKGVSIVWNYSESQGVQVSEWDGSSEGTSAALSGNLSDNAQAAAAVMPELSFDIEDVWGNNIPTSVHFFFLPLPIVASDIIDKLEDLLELDPGDILQWPVFMPVSHSVVLKGQKVSVNANVSVSGHRAYNSDGTRDDNDIGKSESESYDVGLTYSVINIPPTIHGTITFSGDEEMEVAATADAIMSIYFAGFSGGTIDTLAEANPQKTAIGGVYPSSFEAVSGATDIPRTGLYLLDSRVELHKWGYAKVYAEVLDASIFAPPAP